MNKDNRSLLTFLTCAGGAVYIAIAGICTLDPQRNIPFSWWHPAVVVLLVCVGGATYVINRDDTPTPPKPTKVLPQDIVTPEERAILDELRSKRPS